MRCDMGRRARVAMLVALALIPAAFVGCGRLSGSSASDSTPEATVSGTPNPAGFSGRTIPGQVIVTLTKARFAPEEPLLATIHNGLKTSLWTTDHRSGCSLLSLERLTSGTWNMIGQCTQARPTKVIEIPAGSAPVQYIGYPQEMDLGAGWAAGTYQMTLTYAVNREDVASSAATRVHSAQFTIG